MMEFEVVVVMFVFYKQKTAYNMRIIDWSSDVCSSDLDLRSATARAARIPRGRQHSESGQRQALHRAHRVLFGATEGCSQTSAAGSVMSQSQRFIIDIGRASCRERVCQYV